MTRKSCEQLAGAGASAPKTQERIAERAFDLWVARGFRDGSPQEDWLQAQHEVLRKSAPDRARRFS